MSARLWRDVSSVYAEDITQPVTLEAWPLDIKGGGWMRTYGLCPRQSTHQIFSKIASIYSSLHDLIESHEASRKFGNPGGKKSKSTHPSTCAFFLRLERWEKNSDVDIRASNQRNNGQCGQKQQIVESDALFKIRLLGYSDQRADLVEPKEPYAIKHSKQVRTKPLNIAYRIFHRSKVPKIVWWIIHRAMTRLCRLLSPMAPN